MRRAPGLDSDTKRDAREALRKIVNRRDRVLVPQILETLKTLGSRDGSDLTLAIGSIQPPVTEAVPVLIALIDARNETTQRGAISALGRMGPASISAVPRLVECLQSHQDADTREKAAEALGQIGPAAAGSAVPALIKAAGDDKWPKVRRASLSALGEMGPAAREAIPVLRAALRDPDSWISLDARNALFRVDPSSREKVAAISDTSRPEQKGSLFDDLSPLQSTLPKQVPEAFELTIYDQFAMVTAPYADSKNGRGQFTYQGGAVTGPQDATGVQRLREEDRAVQRRLLAGAQARQAGAGIARRAVGKGHARLTERRRVLPGDRLVRLRGEGGFRRVQARWPGRQDPKDVTRFDRFGL